MTDPETEIRALLDQFTHHYEPWMDGHGPETQSCTFARHTLGTLRRARELLATPAAPSGWIVADSSQTRFRFWGDSGPEWTGDRPQAIRFARRLDAEQFCAEDHDAWAVIPYAGPAETDPPGTIARLHAEVGEMYRVAEGQSSPAVAFHISSWADTLSEILSQGHESSQAKTETLAEGLERLQLLGPLLQELDVMERAGRGCQHLIQEHICGWSEHLRQVITGDGLPANRILPGPAGVSVLTVVEMLTDLVGHRDIDEHGRHVLTEAGHLLREYQDEVGEMLASRPGHWSAWSQTETDSDPSDPLCGHSEVWQVGWWQGSLGDPDLVIRARDEGEARELARNLNWVLTSRSHSQEPWSETLNLSDEARGLCQSDTALSSLLYDLDLLPEQLLSQSEKTPGLVKAFHRLYGVLHAWQARDMSETDSSQAVHGHQLRVLQVLNTHHYAPGSRTFIANGQQIRDAEGNLEFVAVPTLREGHRALVKKIEALLHSPATEAPTSALTDEEIREVRDMIYLRNPGC